MRTVPDIQDILQPLEEAIHQPALFGCPPCFFVERDLYALPVLGSGKSWPLLLLLLHNVQ